MSISEKTIQEYRDTISVADFIEKVNNSLLSHHGRVQGEVTSVSKRHPTTIFFTIKDKDEDAILECVIFRHNYVKSGVEIEEGDELVITGTPEIYAPRGKFSLKAQTIEYAGEGALKKAYEELKKKLTKEGLFSLERKRGLPQFPQKIGVITSKSSGVVLQDFSSNLGPYGFKVTLIDSRVEGKDAIHEILASINTLEKEDIDVLVIMRGGGSWESLQPFNTESVVRAIADFKRPVLTGIGHDVDVTLAELAADVGESTPTAVAEALNETWDTLINSIDRAQTGILTAYQHLLFSVSSEVDSLPTKIFGIYHRSISDVRQSLSANSSKIYSTFTQLERKIARARTALQSVAGSMRSSIHEKRRYIKNASKNITRSLKTHICSAQRETTEDMRKVLSEQKDCIQKVKDPISVAEKSIKLANPKRNLQLGYSLSYSRGKLIRSVKAVDMGDETETRLSDGKFTSEIKNVE